MAERQISSDSRRENVLRILGAEREDLIALTREIVRIPSVTGDEQAISDFCARRMRDLGLETMLSKVSASQDNVLGWVRGSGERESVMLTGHLDTVALPDGWTRHPYGGERSDGKIFGHGASNMKGSDTAMIYAAHAIEQAGVKLKGDLVVALVVSECQSGIGSMELMAKGVTAGKFINAEPTDLGILTFHSGPHYIRVNIIGRTGHPGSHDRGVHAAVIMWRLVERLGPMYQKIPADRWLAYDDQPHYGGLPMYHLGSIRAGLGREMIEVPPTTPSFCTAVFNVRVPPKVDVQTTLHAFQNLLEDMQRAEPGFQFELSSYCGKPAFESPHDSEAVIALADAYRLIEGREPRVGAIEPYIFRGSDAGIMQAAGMRDGVVMGPGEFSSSIPDEYIDIDKLISASKIYAAAALNLCGVVMS